jgi:hypothetical protein
MKITVHGDAGKPEYAAAQHVVEVLRPNIEHIDGEIAVRSGITLFGQRRRDVDVLVMGRCPAGIPVEVWDATVPRSKIKKSETRPAVFFSFVFCIEVKDHCFDQLVFENNSAWVRYKDKWSDATAQSEEQKYCLLRYLENLTGWRPFVCNFLWLRNLEQAQLPDFPNNFLAARFSFEELFSKAAAQMKGFVDDGVECFHATKQARAAQLLEDEVRLFTLFDKYKAGIGNLTRSRLEKITRDTLLGDQSYALKRKAKPAMRQARRLSRQSGHTEHVYGEANYAAQTWPRQRRIIIKAEVVRAQDKTPKDNPRFVITNMKQSSQWLYEQVYCQRGEIENRIKELHDLQIDRTSCNDFWANQLRVLLTAAAYVLMQELRLQAAHTNCARAQVWTLRERLLKLGARVLVSVRRVVVHLPSSFPFLPAFRQVALALGASPG